MSEQNGLHSVDITKDCTPYGVFNLLKNGNWVSSDTLRKVCGDNFDRRIRDLRSKSYGSFKVIKQTNDTSGLTYYRIHPDELKEKRQIVLKLNHRVRPFSPEPIDKIKNVKLTVGEIVLLLAYLKNDPTIHKSPIGDIWESTRISVIGELSDSIEKEVDQTVNLFEG